MLKLLNGLQNLLPYFLIFSQFPCSCSFIHFYDSSFFLIVASLFG